MHRRSFLHEKAGCPTVHVGIAEPLRLIVSWIHRSPAFLSFPRCFVVSRSEMEVFQTSNQNSLVMKPAVSSHSHYAPDVQGSGQSEQQTGEQDGWAGEFDLGMLPM